MNQRIQRPVEGNVVRKTDSRQAAPVRLKRRKRQKASAAQSRLIRRQKRRLIAAGIAATALVVIMCCLMLNSLETNGALSDEVYSLESRIEEMTICNDAREYEINSSVDLNEVIRVATEELGMVRSSQAQVVTYRVKNSEYLQQVAAVPVD